MAQTTLLHYIIYIVSGSVTSFINKKDCSLPWTPEPLNPLREGTPWGDCKQSPI